MCSKLTLAVFAVALIVASPIDPADAFRSKLKSIQSGHARAGSVFTFSPAEVNAYARSEVPATIPEGLRQPRVEMGAGMATGTAMVDFLKLRHGQGEKTPWLMAKLIEGEKSLKIVARIQSGHGQATVFLQRVELSGLAVSGPTLDFLIHNFFTPLYPDAKIDQPFQLADRVDRIEVAPTGARVVIGR